MLVWEKFADQSPYVLIKFPVTGTIVDEQKAAGGNVALQGSFLFSAKSRIPESGHEEEWVVRDFGFLCIDIFQLKADRET